MELLWEDLEAPDGPFFTRDVYERCSLSPSIRELWSFLQSPEEAGGIKQNGGAGAKKVCSATKDSMSKISSSVSQESHEDSCDSEDPCAESEVEAAEGSERAQKAEVTLGQGENEVDDTYPAPRLPYPCQSGLSIKEHKIYLDILKSKKPIAPPQWLRDQVNREVMHFTEYLREVAQVCSEDYNIISPGALQYSEDVLKSCLECIKTIPQLYQIHEMTSLTGGTFNPALTLTFEKQLLIMGNVDITDHKMVPADAQLASDYQSVSSVTPPAKKAKDMHATISSDSNAETLSARYEPHVCLTRDALFRLLNNHGPDFGEHWEVPVWVKLNPGKGRGQKTVYIDSPLLKTEITMREMNHIYHEESLKHSVKKNGQKHVFHLMSELPANDKPFTSESSKRNVVSFENDSLDFEVDLTDLETFGETTPAKKPKKELHNSTKITTHPAVSETVGTKPKQIHSKSDQETEHTSSIDSDEEKLVIDDSVSQTPTPKKQPLPSAAPFSADIPLTSESTSDKPELSSSPQKLAKHGRHSRRPRDCGDQLSEILRMQSAMFNPTNNSAKSSATSQEIKSPSQSLEPSVHPPAVSLVKPCVTSYLERNESVNSHESAPLVNILTEHKRLLSKDLQAGAEDEQDYDAPEEGNLIYKLYSLHDLLLMVRSSVALSHTRSVGSSENKHVPVHVLPKLEYQLCYGVECLSSSEACELWTEALLHSSTVSYTAHINAHTSKVALLRKLPDGWIHSISCGFKPSKSLNILHHLLKKLSGLAEGRYLIVHKAGEPFVALMKEAGGKVARGSYNLQQVHSSVPRPPASGAIPWIPVDPAVVLPFHQRHGRIPCSFPVTNVLKQKVKGGNQWAQSQGGRQHGKNNTEGNAKKKKKKKRAARRNKYMKKLIHKSV
ncbi:little elongation complex subunit 2 isoform X1 [Takifugu rubripes]|uniref:Interactor of little elongation complex ELL subunit 2 n=1 Tax=Takifugu rubripes TaxID=31033 RepID=H2TSI3_TAKRU|nr:little elongation complex subunit 2 isoform X1 [Takifugu rubripes]